MAPRHTRTFEAAFTPRGDFPAQLDSARRLSEPLEGSEIRQSHISAAGCRMLTRSAARRKSMALVRDALPRPAAYSTSS